MTNVVAWLCLVVFLVSVGLVLGVLLTNRITEQQRKTLMHKEAELEAGWQALASAQRLYAVYLRSRQAMQEAAIQEHQRQASL